MIRELAEVVAIKPGIVVVSTQLKSGCSGCEQQRQCGAGLLSQVFSDRRAQFEVPTQGAFSVGDQVELSIPEQHVTRYSLLVYSLPILALLLTALLTGPALNFAEGASILCSFAAMALTFYGLRCWLRYRDLQVQQLLSLKAL
ncbi:SoxR reducing system RseC family protein [Idiomarina xiamenensis]|uniref:Positive regulator of sigma E activity n=1 Tax=Idiomarina xiamenensis 10-D-4 TaxID=740709 RepID=K2KAG2_9GAMM|nr:SoxR reducing system RseC family protein [Idiomarina xiamenensis]EKE84808.1 positive regulator of sigma E activity [Idiomarina xiamenensis 10-D-4]